MTLSGLNHLGHQELTLSWFEVSKQAEAKAFWYLMKSQFLQLVKNAQSCVTAIKALV